MPRSVGRVLAGMALAGLVAVAGCGGRPANEVAVKGADSAVILAQKWADAFMAANPGKIVKVSGGGSAVGIAALIGGGADLALTTRAVTKDEADQVLARRKAEAKSTAVALDAVVLYVNGKNTVSTLSPAGVTKLFTGEITDWKKAGGRKGAIALFGAEPSSDVALAFKALALKDAEPLATVKALPGTPAVLEAVAADKLAIGYGGLSAVPKGVKAVKIRVKKGTYSAVAAGLRSGKYPYTQKILLTAAGAPAEGSVAAEFLAFVLSADGQKLCAEAGYVSLKAPAAPKKRTARRKTAK